MDHIVVDIEIAHTIEETPGGWDATHLLGVSCAVVYDMTKDRYTIYGDTDDERDRLKNRIVEADRVTTFNGWKFDFPVIWGLPARERVEMLAGISDDLLRRIWSGLGLNPDSFSKYHGGWGLDVVCQATIDRGKTGYGGGAPLLYQQGKWVELINYCLEDVRLTRDLCRFIDERGLVLGSYGRSVELKPWKAGS